MKSVRNMFTVFITCVLLISDSHLVEARVLPSTELAYQPLIEHQAVAVNPYENVEQAEYHIIYELNGGENAENNSDTILESELPFTKATISPAGIPTAISRIRSQKLPVQMPQTWCCLQNGRIQSTITEMWRCIPITQQAFLRLIRKN